MDNDRYKNKKEIQFIINFRPKVIIIKEILMFWVILKFFDYN